MDLACLEYCLTDQERDAFEQNGYTSPTEEDVPLKGWIGEHLGPGAVAP